MADTSTVTTPPSADSVPSWAGAGLVWTGEGSRWGGGEESGEGSGAGASLGALGAMLGIGWRGDPQVGACVYFKQRAQPKQGAEARSKWQEC